ncbi:hypothetical protein GCM10007079_08720 [Nocardiopsis terrae]|uniref:Amino acid adenylation domain-containing protein n=1 Tax=Nocardiopsis terrae TaxID=372655 RepID=A0ABR9HD10_9ACTN|nr:non-ribosomal peptide synthetase [Nocardiopsis terrae]MBE1456910.1 amino acid adenylation domain-containing protein [Nocardiopsis terrae]GHC74447.1 hypothetical protein GCM10007079_08720 [Nocardiopsis terrae]
MTTLTVPRLGEGIVEVTVTSLLKRPGETVAKDEIVYEIEHDKAALAIESPASGVLARWLVEEGQVVPVGTPVAEVSAEEPPPPPTKPAQGASPRAAGPAAPGERPRIPPRTRAYARRLGFDENLLPDIPRRGESVMPADVERYAASMRTSRNDSVDEPISASQKRLNAVMRTGAAEAVTAVVSVNLEDDVLERAARGFTGTGETGAFTTPFQVFAVAAARACADFPALRSRRVGDDRVRVFERADLGIACAQENGDLTVGVVRSADRLDDEEFGTAYASAVERALQGESEADGSVTLTLSHLGDEDVTFAVPVVVPPAVATLFLGAPEQSGPTGVRRVVLAFDHTVMNGHGAARYLGAVVDGVRALAPDSRPSAAPPLRRTMAGGDVLGRVGGIAARVAGHDLDPRRPLGEQGFDSARAVKLTRELSEEFGTRVPVTAVWRHPTLEALSRLCAGSAHSDGGGGTPDAEAEESAPPADDGDIAVVGMSCVVPGAADTDAYWRLLERGECRIAEVPPGRLAGAVPDGFRAAMLDGVDRFDAEFFGVTPRQAASMDPQQRILLESSWHALEHAGLNPDHLEETDTGVYVAACSYDYRELLVATGQADGYATVGTFPAFLANRVSHFYGTTGPSITVDTACSGALTALSLAEAALRSGDCGVALVGAANILSNAFNATAFHTAGMLSRSGESRVFDAAANGFVRGEGAGWVVLKPLRSAMIDGDPVLAVIRGTSVNHGGRSASLTAPNPRAQSTLIATALGRAGLTAADLGYLEAHGTGTPLGDPIELEAVREVLTKPVDAPGTAAGPDGRMWVGSAKANIGHLEGASGLVGLIKAVHVLRNGLIPPTPNVDRLNPEIDFREAPLAVADRAVSWPEADGKVRRAAVSSFGFGGSNAHTVLEEAPPAARTRVRDRGEAIYAIPLSADGERSLRRLAAALADFVERTGPDLAALAWTLQSGRKSLSTRAVLCARGPAPFVEAARALARGDEDGALARPGREAALTALPSGDGFRDGVRAWLRGQDADGETLWQGADRPRRIPLVPYPFERGSHWFPGTADEPGSADATEGDRADPRAERTGTAHRVSGREVVSGADLLDLMSERGSSELHGVRFITPVNPEDRHALHLAATGEGGRTVRCSGTVHARAARAVPADGRVEPPPVPPSTLRTRSADLGSELARRGVETDTLSSAVTDLRQSDGWVTGRLSVPGEGERWTCPVAWLDTVLQAACVAVGDHRPRLAAGVDSFVWTGGAPGRAEFTARLVGTENDNATVDVGVTDGTGEPLLSLRGLRLTVPPERGADRVRLFDSRWAEEEGPRAEGEQGPHLVLYDRATAALADDVRAVWSSCGAVAVGTGDRSEDIVSAVRDAVASAGDGPVRVCLLVGGARWTDDSEGVGHLRSWLLSLVETAQSLSRARAVARIRLATTALTAPDGGLPAPGAALQGALIGALRTLPRESSAFTVAAVDLPGGVLEDVSGGTSAVEAVLDEPCASLPALVALRGGRRYRQILVELPEPSDGPGAGGFREGGLYVVLGGARGVGAETARYLASRYGARLVLVGRSEPDPGIRDLLEELGTAVYRRADASSAQDVRRLLEECVSVFGEPDGVINSVGTVSDARLTEMTAADLDRSLASKVGAVVELRRALRGTPDTDLVLFSSVAGVFGSEGGLNYAAANAFLGHYATAGDGTGPTVRTFDWGLWRGTGLARRYSAHVRKQYPGIEDFPPEKGAAALDAGMRGGASRILAVAGDPRQLRSLGVSPGDGRPDPAVRLDGYARSALARAMADLGLTEARRGTDDPDTVAERLGIVDGHRRLLAAIMDVLPAGGSPPPDTHELGYTRAGLLRDHPDLAGHVDLLDAALADLGPVLRGELRATGVLFPGGDMSAVGAIYSGNGLFDPANEDVATHLAAAVTDINRRTGRPARVLEVGAGVGGTTEAVLNALDRAGASAEYTYTDVSPAFLNHGRTRFGGRVDTRLLDIERDPGEQGFERGRFDIMLASNVMHATRDLARSLDHVRGLLAENGTFLMAEIVVPAVCHTVTFGLTEGWWRFTDPGYRLPHGPLLSMDGWSRVLRDHGWERREASAHRSSPGALAVLRCVPTSASGTAALRAPEAGAEGSPSPEADRLPPEGADDLVPEILTLVARLTGRAPDGLDSGADFPGLGVDSLLNGEMVDALRERFPGHDLPATILYEHTSPLALARWLADTRTAPPENREVPGTGSPVPVPQPVAPPTAAPTVETRGPTPPSGRGDGVAVVGLAGRYPGASDLDAFWRLLAEGRSPVTEVPGHRWDWRTARSLGGGYARWGCFVDGEDRFDPHIFGITSRDAAVMDPQERLFLEIAWEAFETAGYSRRTLSGSAGRRVGVFAGVTANSHLLAQRDARRSGADNPEYAVTAAASVANRVSHALDLNGPSLAVDTMCSSSLTAVHLACRALEAGDADMALAGGVNLYLHPDRLAGLCALGMPSRGSRTRAFGAGGDGFVPGEGAGALVLKPFERAVADGDTVYAVIRGTGVNHGGGAGRYTVPNPGAQADVVRETLQRARVRPEAIDYVEAHGTGTRLGDPIELRALALAFGDRPGRRDAVRIGSVKSNIGHAEAAAGVAGLTKTILQMLHGRLAPTLNSEPANPEVDLGDGAFRLQRDLEAWPTGPGGGPPCAAVSSFGAGGANAHVVLEGHPREEPEGGGPDGPLTIPLSAPSRPRLRALADRLRAWLSAEPDDGHLSRHPVRLADMAHTLAVGRECWPHRAAIQTDDRAALDAALAALAEGGVHPALTTEEDAVRAEATARAWVVDGAWPRSAVDAGRRRVALPTTPFERVVFPTPSVPTGSDERRTDLPLSDSLRTPDAVRASVRFGSGARWVAHHTVDGEPVLPAALQPELVYEALLSCGVSPYEHEIRDLVWTAAAGGLPMTVRAELDEPGVDGSRAFRVLAGTTTVGQGHLAPSARETVRPTLTYALDALEGRLAEAYVGADAFYRVFRDRGFSYGPLYRAVRRVFSDGDEAFGFASLPEGEDPDGRHVVHPALLDAACQTAVYGLLREAPEGGARYRPMAVDRLSVHGPVTGAVYLHTVRARKADDGATHVFDLRVVSSEDGRVIAEADGFRVRVQEAAAQSRPASEAPRTPGTSETSRTSETPRPPDVGGYRLGWEPAPRPGRSAGPDGPVWVIGSGRPAQALARFAHAELSGLAEADEKALLRLLEETGAPRTVLVDLDGVVGCDFGARPLDIDGVVTGWEEFRDSTLRPVFTFLRDLIRTRGIDGVRLLVTADAGDDTGPVHHALHGLLRTLGAETSRIRPCLVLVERDALADEASLAPRLFAEDDPADDWVRLGGADGRRTPVLRPETGLPPAAPADLVRPDGTYLIVGGLGGLGRRVASAVLGACPDARVVLTGRSEPDPAVLDSLRETAGVAARPTALSYHRCDAGDREQVGALAANLERDGVRLRGVFYMAGLLRDGFLRGKSLEDVEEVCRAKALGAVSVDAAFADHPLDFFVMASSLAALIGNEGQGDYAFANGFLDGFARARDRWAAQGSRSGRTAAVALPILAGAGMSPPEAALDHLHHTYGLRPLDTAGAVRALWPRLAPEAGSAHVALVAGDRDRWERALGVEQPDVGPSGSAPVSGSGTERRGSDPRIIDGLARHVAEAVGVDPAVIRPDAPLEEFGVDSVALLRLNRALEGEFGRVPQSVLLDSATLNDLAVRLSATTGATVEPAGPPSPRAEVRSDEHVLLPDRLVGIWTADQTAAPEAPYNISLAWRLPRRADRDALARAVRALVERHRVLAASVRFADGELVFVPSGLPPEPVSRRVGPEDDLDALVRAEADRRFDPSAEPLLRTVLWTGADGDVLQFTTHHLAVDGWSADILRRDFDALYSAQAGEEAPLPPAADFADVLRRQNADEREGGERAAAYWRRRLAEPATGRPFPTRAADDAVGEHREYSLPSGVADLLHETAARAGVFPFAVLLAAFSAALGRATGARELRVAVPVHGRGAAAEESAVGCFMGSVPIQVDLTPARPVATWLREIQEEVRNALAHAETPYPVLAEMCREAGGQPSVPSVTLAFQNWKRDSSPRRILPDRYFYRRGQRGHFDLGLEVAVTATGVDVIANHRSSTLDGEAVDALVDDLRRMVTEIGHSHDAVVGDLMSPEAATLLARFDAEAKARPEAVAAEDAGGSLTYAELSEGADRVAARVEDESGGGEPVAVLVDRSVRLPVVLLGVLRSGRPYVPLDASYPLERLRMIIEDAGCAVAVADAHLADRLPEGVRRLDAAAAVSQDTSSPSDPRDLPGVAPADLAYLMFTSGSSGRPKGVAVTHSNVVHTLDAIARRIGWTRSDRLLAVTTVCFDISVLEIFLPLLSGGTVVIADQADTVDGRRLARVLTERRITALQATPAGWRLLVDAGWRGTPGLTALCGGEQLPDSLARELTARVRRLWNVYGPTEATIWSTIAEIEHGGRVSLGEPIGATDLVVTGVGGSGEAPPGEPGELWIGGPGVARGYWNRPELTAERFTAHPLLREGGGRYFRTGDLVRTVPEGGMVFLGRADSQVKIRGHRVELAEVEAALERHPGVARGVAYARGEGAHARIVAVIEPVRGAPEPSHAALREAASTVLPPWMLPARTVVADALPLTLNGKTDRARAAELIDSEEDPSGPASADGGPGEADVRERVAAAWCDVLGVARVEHDQRFFHAGGNSLLLGRLLARLDALYPEAELEVTDLFANPTVDAQSALLTSRIGPPRPDRPRPSPEAGAAPAPAGPDTASRRELRRAYRLGETL